MTGRGRRARFAGGVVAAAALLSAVPPPTGEPPAATAQPAPEPSDVELSVEELDGMLTPDDAFEVELSVVNDSASDAEDLRVVGTLHTAVGSRFALQRALDDGRLGSVLDGFAETLDRLPSGDTADVTMSREVDALGIAGAGDAGVYPLRFQLLEDDEVVDQVRTAVVVTPSEVDQPVRTAFVVPVDGPPLAGPDGELRTERLVEHVGGSGRAKRLVDALAERDPFPVTVAVNGLLLDHAAQAVLGDHGGAAEQATGFLDRLRELAGRPSVETLAMPYGRADLVALNRGDMTEEALRHVREGRDAVGRHTDTPANPDVVWPPDGLDEDTLAVLADEGTDTVMLSEDYLRVPNRQPLSPSPVRELRGPDDGTMTALVPDPWLSDILADERLAAAQGPVVTVQRVLAETAAAYFEQPFTEDTRGLLLAPPQAWDPPEGVVGRLAETLPDAPWLRPVRLARLERTIEPTTPPVRVDYPDAAHDRELPPRYVDALRLARHELGALSRVLPTDPEVPSRFDGLVRMAASVHYRSQWPTDSYSAFPIPLSEGQAVLDRVLDTAEDVFSSVEVVEGPRVLIDDEGEIPVTLANDSDVTLRLRVRLLTGRFSFAGGSSEQLVTVQAGGQRTLTFRARAITPGAQSPIGVIVEDPEGVSRLAEGRVVVRSTGVSVAALLATVGAGLFLVAWTGRQILRRRRGAGARGAVADGEAQPVPPEPTVTTPEA